MCRPTSKWSILNLNNSTGITLNKAAVFNDTVNTSGNLTSEGEFDVDVGLTGTAEFLSVR